MSQNAMVSLSGRLVAVSAQRAHAPAQPVGASESTTPDQHAQAPQTPPPELLSAVQAMTRAAGRLDQIATGLRPQIESEVLGLALAVARRILATEIEKGDYDISEIVTRLLDQLPSTRDVVVRLHPADLQLLRRSWSDGADLEERLATLELVADHTVDRAECIIETAAGFVEATIESQLARIEEGFRHED